MELYNNIGDHHHHSFRNATMFLVCHYMLLRGENARNMELADLQCLDLPMVGANDSYPVIIYMGLIRNSRKTNRFNITQMGACMRNRMVETSIFMAMSLHFSMVPSLFPTSRQREREKEKEKSQ